MARYQVGDTVVHWTYGSGKIVAVEDKGLPGEPCFYYVIEGSEQTLWVPIDEAERSSLHLLTSHADFHLLTDILRSQGEKLSNNPYQRRDQLGERMQKASPEDLCRVIRDLTYHSHRGKLSSSDTAYMRAAQSLLLDEWERALEIPRGQAKSAMEWMLKETPAR